jgi:hypothetical protein
MGGHGTRFEDTCEILGIGTNVSVVGEILQFREHDIIVAMINRSARVTLRWKERANLYVGALGGVEFQSGGPEEKALPKTRTRRP